MTRNLNESKQSEFHVSFYFDDGLNENILKYAIFHSYFVSIQHLRILYDSLVQFVSLFLG